MIEAAHDVSDEDAPRRALRRACEIAGGQNALAAKVKTTQGQIWYWLTKAKKGTAAEFVIAIEAATGVPRHALRPDLYPPPDADAPADAPAEASS